MTDRALNEEQDYIITQALTQYLPTRTMEYKSYTDIIYKAQAIKDILGSKNQGKIYNIYT